MKFVDFLNEAKEAPVKWTVKTRTSSSKPKEANWQRPIAIAGLGSVNLKTGASKYFNVYEEWKEDSTYEIWKMSDGNTRIVATSGTKPIHDVGDAAEFSNDQSGRSLGNGKMIDWATGTDLKNAISEYGNSLPGFTYK